MAVGLLQENLVGKIAILRRLTTISAFGTVPEVAQYVIEIFYI
jgi:hypothetical protein